MAGEQQPRRRAASFSKRRPSSHALDPLLIPTQDGQEFRMWLKPDGQLDIQEDDVIEEGKELFHNFVVEQIEKESPDKLEDVRIKTPVQYKFPLWQKTGRDLRMLADDFARTKERERVRDQANQIQMDMTNEDFRLLLEELFHGEGITSERIVVLFYFCADVAIRFLKTGTDMFQRFVSWSMNFIVERVCSWVAGQGGWSQVLQSPFNSWKKALFWTSLALLVVVGFRYWRRRL